MIRSYALVPKPGAMLFWSPQSRLQVRTAVMTNACYQNTLWARMQVSVHGCSRIFADVRACLRMFSVNRCRLEEMGIGADAGGRNGRAGAHHLPGAFDCKLRLFLRCASSGATVRRTQGTSMKTISRELAAAKSMTGAF